MPERAPLEYVIANLGTPAEASEQGVRAFLREFLGDPMVVEYPRWFWIPLLNGVILRKRPVRIAKLYASIWQPGGSPLRVQTESLAAALQAAAPEGTWVSSAYRYGAPNIAERLERAFQRAERVVFTSLFPQRTASSSGSADAEARAVAHRLGASDRLELRPLDPTHGDYVGALADRILASQSQFSGGRAEHLLVSFHSIPAGVDRREGRRYTRDCEATYEALLERLDWDPTHASLAYQSVFGPAKWVGPATSKRLAELGQEGIERLLVCMPGFLTDGLETLEEIAVEGLATFQAAGGREMIAVPALADHPSLIRAILDPNRVAIRPAEAIAAKK